MTRTQKAWSAVRRLDGLLMPFMGPAQLGPYDEEKPTTKPCPLCGGDLAAHEFDRRPGRPTQMYCPNEAG